MKARYTMLAASLLLTLGGCSEPTVPNYNSPTEEDAGKDPSALQLLATGLLSQLRGPTTGYTSDVGIFGRESFNYFPTDGRSHTHYVNNPGAGLGLDYSGFATGSGIWNAGYNNGRNILNFLNAVASAPITQAEKDAAEGFAKTIEALGYLYIIGTRDTIGAIIEMKADPKELAPFVSRDAVYAYVSTRLDEAEADLAAAGSVAFPFALTSGFGGFNTPATFRQLNRAIAARALAYRGSINQFSVPTGAACAPTSCYAQALTALGASFLNTASALNVGPFHTYSTATGDAQNTLFFSTTSDIVAHPSIQTDAPIRAGGTRDLRLIAKVDTATPLKQPNAGAQSGIPSGVRFRMYPDRNAAIKILRNEELILLRAEARWFTGDRLNAIADIDFIRVNSGGLPVSSLTPGSTDQEFITELLLQRRYSLLFEGHRWIDHRRFNRLAQLPLDQPQHFVAKVQPIPQSECLIRVNFTTPDMRGPGCP
jgi:hypothetical protein